MKRFSILILVAMFGFGMPIRGHAFIFGPSEQERSAEVQYARTPDGWKIALEHVPPSWGSTGKPPVILTHGLGYNGDFWMLSRQVNLAQYLADNGYDVWILSLRGAGKSTKWVYKLAEVGMEAPGIISGVDNKDYATVAVKGLSALLKLSQAKMVNASANPKYINWSFDDYVNFDVPTAIEHVKRATGAPQVFWVGHSMGGNVMLAHLATNQRNDLRGVVTVGSQLTMVNGHIVSQYINTLQWVRLTQIRGSVESEEARKIAKEQARALLFNQNNMEGDLVQRLETAGTDFPAVGVLGQYAELVGSGQFKTADNRFNYAQNAQNINVPLLISAGAKDGFVHATDLENLHRKVQSQDVTAVIWGPQVGMYPFGHNDALISRRAAAQVYPVILQWLNDRAMGIVASPQRQQYQGQKTYQHPAARDKTNPQTPMKALPALDY